MRPKIAEVKLMRDGSRNFFYIGFNNIRKNEMAIVITEHGQEVGEVLKVKELTERKRYPKLVRRMNEKDIERYEKIKKRGKQDFNRVKEVIEKAELDMKLTKIYYTFDNKKLFIYYTSEGRVDFRELLKELASEFKKRIQMVQIGVRDETKMMGGIGHCGQVFCCHRFLKEFSSITADMIKVQGLSTNIEKLMGPCGRLFCCLNYELEIYKEIMKDLPSVGEEVTTPEGKGTIVEIRPFLREAKVELENKNIKVFSFSEIGL